MIYCICAVEQGQGIGFKGQMPWPHLAGDMKWFQSLTTGNVVVMGSTTFKSLGKPLTNRINVVISSHLYPGANLTYSDPVEAITDLKLRFSTKKIFIIGGQALYDSVKHLVDVFYVTEIDASYECDKFFDLQYVKENTSESHELRHFGATEEAPAYTIKEYIR